MIDLIFAPYTEMFRYFAQGWRLVSTMADQTHGEFSVLLDRKIQEN